MSRIHLPRPQKSQASRRFREQITQRPYVPAQGTHATGFRQGTRATIRPMAAQLKITRRRADDVVLLDLNGRLEIGDGDIEFAACLDELIRSGERKILVNLQDVVHIDSGGIGVLVSKQMSLRKRGGDLRLFHLPESTHRAFAVTRLLTVFDTFASEVEAIASYGSGTVC
jgi:anti-sigma B factor antagonist